MRETPFSTEDARKQIPSQFEVTIIAAKRARELYKGASSFIEQHTDETPMSTALREIAAGYITRDYLFK
jgi:DNA-directed RNA polymerase subunit omega